MKFSSSHSMLNFILGRRIHDWSSKGFQNFPFMSVHFWDESPYGEWILNVDSTGPNEKGNFYTVVVLINGQLFLPFSLKFTVREQKCPLNLE